MSCFPKAFFNYLMLLPLPRSGSFIKLEEALSAIAALLKICVCNIEIYLESKIFLKVRAFSIQMIGCVRAFSDANQHTDSPGNGNQETT
jgi:hypothetical protein